MLRIRDQEDCLSSEITQDNGVGFHENRNLPISRDSVQCSNPVVTIVVLISPCLFREGLKKNKKKCGIYHTWVDPPR